MPFSQVSTFFLSDLIGIDSKNFILGSIIPRQIPVNVFVPSHGGTPDAIFDNPEMSPRVRRTKIVMTSPERPPISGLVEICVSSDETRPCGINVELNGAMGVDMRVEVMEEICRRGASK